MSGSMRASVESGQVCACATLGLGVARLLGHRRLGGPADRPHRFRLVDTESEPLGPIMKKTHNRVSNSRMVENAEFPSCMADLNVQQFVGQGLLAPCLGRIWSFFDRLATKSAEEERIPLNAQSNAGIYALWGRLSDGQVLGLQRAGSGWRMTTVPIPSSLIRSLRLPVAWTARAELAWIQIGPDQISRFCQGRLIPIWEAQFPVPTPSKPTVALV